MVSWQELFIKTVREVENLDDSVKNRGFFLKQKLKVHDRFTATLTMYQPFIEKERLETPTFDYWSSYILFYLRAARKGDWKLHLASLRQILPWFLAYDRVNYAIYLPAYISEMDSLPRTHPAISDSLGR